MKLQDIVGELLYIGFVAEKGRCYGVRWKAGYKKRLQLHIAFLYNLQKQLQDYSEQEFVNVLNDFISFCKKEKEIGRFYSFENSLSERIEMGKSQDRVNQMIEILMCELIKELNKLFVDKRKVYELLNSLHNLPRVYLNAEGNTLCNLRMNSISVEDAVSFSLDMMPQNIKEKCR